jgi:hypothetical protein
MSVVEALDYVVQEDRWSFLHCTWNFITTLMFCIYPDSPSPRLVKNQLLGVERMHFVNIKQTAVFLSGQEADCEFFSLDYIEMRHEHTRL